MITLNFDPDQPLVGVVSIGDILGRVWLKAQAPRGASAQA